MTASLAGFSSFLLSHYFTLPVAGPSLSAKQRGLLGEFVINAYFKTQTSVDCAMHNEQKSVDNNGLSEFWRLPNFVAPKKSVSY